MIDLFGMHGSDDADVVGNRPDLGKLIGNELAGFSVPFEWMLRTEALKGVPLALKLSLQSFVYSHQMSGVV